MDRWIALYEKVGVWEQYNPETGESSHSFPLPSSPLSSPPFSSLYSFFLLFILISGANYGVEGLGMSTLIVDWLYRLGRV